MLFANYTENMVRLGYWCENIYVNLDVPAKTYIEVPPCELSEWYIDDINYEQLGKFSLSPIYNDPVGHCSKNVIRNRNNTHEYIWEWITN